MENNNDHNVPIKAPRRWNMRDLYQEYAKYVLEHNPQCWGQYNKAACQKNYWIFTTATVKGKPKVIEVMNYRRWKAIITTYFEAAKNRIIQHGEELSLGRLGSVSIRRCERNFDNKAVNFGATGQRPKVLNDQGKLVPDKIIYFMDDDYLRIAWRKYQQYKNEQLYEFIPTSGDDKKDGFKQQLSKANMENPALKSRYRFVARSRKPQTVNDDIPVV